MIKYQRKRKFHYVLKIKYFIYILFYLHTTFIAVSFFDGLNGIMRRLI